jgi:hypothetical protein
MFTKWLNFQQTRINIFFEMRNRKLKIGFNTALLNNSIAIFSTKEYIEIKKS